MAQRPIALGLFLCEQVIIEAGTRNVTPVNCLTHKSVKAFPSEKVPLVVFAELTDGAGQVTLETVVQRLDNLEVVYRFGHSTTFEDQLKVIRYMARIRCSFPLAGYYQVALLADREIVAQRKLRVLEETT
jgi:hypothetical protein